MSPHKLKGKEHVARCPGYAGLARLWLGGGLPSFLNDDNDDAHLSWASLLLLPFSVMAPHQIWAVVEALGSVTPNFSIAAAFGNVHGVYKPGNVKLNPGILATHQARDPPPNQQSRPVQLTDWHAFLVGAFAFWNRKRRRESPTRVVSQPYETATYVVSCGAAVLVFGFTVLLACLHVAAQSK